MSDEGEEEEEEDVSGSSDDEEKAEEEGEAGGSDESAVDSEEEDGDSGPDLARGKGNVETSSEDEEDDVDAVLRREEEEVEHAWGELCRDAPRTEEVGPREHGAGGSTAPAPLKASLPFLQVSARLAVCNMDWDRLKAADLLVLLRSFAPTGGAVLSVKVPSPAAPRAPASVSPRGPTHHSSVGVGRFIRRTSGRTGCGWSRTRARRS